MPPPEIVAVLLFSVLLLTLLRPVLKLSRAPPNTGVLLLSVLFVTLTVAVLLLRMPPPEDPPATVPFEMVKSANVTIFGLAIVTLKTRELLLPEIVNRLAPGPWKVRFLSISNSPVVSVIGLVTWPGVTLKVSVWPDSFAGPAEIFVAQFATVWAPTLAFTDWSGPLVNEGASLTGLTVMVKFFGADVSCPPLAVPPLSLSTTVIVAEPL